MEKTSRSFNETFLKEENKPLIISTSKNKVLSKEQLAFNKYIQKLEKIREKIKSEEAKFDTLTVYFSTRVAPQQKGYGEDLVELAKACYDILQQEKLSKTNKEKLTALILSNLTNAFQHIIPDTEIKAVYDALNPISYAEEEAEQMFELKEMMEEMFKNEFGMDVDFSDLDMSEESIARKMAEMKDQFENLNHENTNKKKSRKKTKKQLEAEIKQKEIETLQKKSIRSIYMSLAKLLHPDLESDETLKLDKEELMKKVISAYQEGDLHTLLKLEIEIIHKQSENLDHLTNDKLKFINTVLKNQVADLEDELNMLHNSPRYQSISDVMFMSEKQALKHFESCVNILHLQRKEITADTRELKGDNRLRFITPLLKMVGKRQSTMFGDLNDREMEDLFNFKVDDFEFSRNPDFKNRKKK